VYACQFPGFGSVDMFDARVGVDAPGDGHEEHARQRDIVYVSGGPGNEPGIFLAFDGLTNVFHPASLIA
jgi:hypothetical protein